VFDGHGAAASARDVAHRRGTGARAAVVARERGVRAEPGAPLSAEDAAGSLGAGFNAGPAPFPKKSSAANPASVAGHGFFFASAWGARAQTVMSPTEKEQPDFLTTVKNT
jgi:hypothetical protein